MPPLIGYWEYMMDGEWVPFEVETFTVKTFDGGEGTHNVLYSNYGE